MLQRKFSFGFTSGDTLLKEVLPLPGVETRFSILTVEEFRYRVPARISDSHYNHQPHLLSPEIF